jgi:hypothetical protein
MLSCLDCHKRYVGQTGRSFRTRFKEHAQDYRLGNQKTNFAKHLIDNHHTWQPIEDSMSVLHISNIGCMMNTIERYYIYKETSHHNQINDRHNVLPNAIFEVVLNHVDATWPHQFHAIRPTNQSVYTTDELSIYHYSIQRIRITPSPGNEHNILLQSTNSIKQRMETWYIRLLMTTSSLPTIYYIGHHQPHVSSQCRRSILT